MRVLVVEDSVRLRRSIETALTRSGYAVDAVDDGRDGLALAASTDYDAIVLDIMLPGLDGLTLLQRLRAQARDTHVLLLTAKDTVQDRVDGLDAGADDYLVKPFALEELLARVAALLPPNLWAQASAADRRRSGDRHEVEGSLPWRAARRLEAARSTRCSNISRCVREKW